jgi:hypothetical protein
MRLNSPRKGAKKTGDTKSVGELGRLMNRLSSIHEGIIFHLAKGNCRHLKFYKKVAEKTGKLAKLAPSSILKSGN